MLIGRSTTALCALSSLRWSTTLGHSAASINASNSLLIGSIRPGIASSTESISTPDSLIERTEITDVQFKRAWDLIDRALTQEGDPLAALFLRPAVATSSASGPSFQPGFALRDGLGMALDGWGLTHVQPTSAALGSTLTLGGQGLPTSTDSVTVKVNGQTCTVLTANATGTALTVKLPVAGIAAGAYPVEVVIGPWTHKGLTLTVL